MKNAVRVNLENIEIKDAKIGKAEITIETEKSAEELQTIFDFAFRLIPMFKEFIDEQEADWNEKMAS